jgi:hypothetical protein
MNAPSVSTFLLRFAAFVPCASYLLATPPADAAKDFHSWAATPPMGWNSWDCFATTITEAQTKAQADFMAAQLKSHGWQYIVVDIQWYEPGAKSHDYRKDATLTMDGNGRLLPAPNRFPSAANGAGFTPLADYIHSLGLKFGIHLMRGIPRQAVEKNLPILGTNLHAQDIADRVHICPWNSDMYGVDMAKPGAQAYYNSVFTQIAAWGVDYVKVDDLSRPYFQNVKEVEAIRKAIDATGRPMVLSLSPGETDFAAASHVREHANLWRISDDFWDRWLALRDQFARLERWNSCRKTGAWPDADMLPLGTLVLGKRTTRFTPDEQVTLMTLWSIARSPLMHGGDMTKTDPFTLSLLTNDEVLAVNQKSLGNRPVFDHDGLIAWCAEMPGTKDVFLAVFNARDRVPLTAANARHISTVVSSESSTATAIDVDLNGATKLFLVAEPASDADGFTHVFWREPCIVMNNGDVRPLTDLAWTSADAQWDSAAVRKGPTGKAEGVTAQARVVIQYALPAGSVRFKATGLVEKNGEGAADGKVKFLTVVATRENEDTGPGLPVEVKLSELGIKGPVQVRNLWTHLDEGNANEAFSPVIPFHGAKLYRLTPLLDAP